MRLRSDRLLPRARCTAIFALGQWRVAPLADPHVNALRNDVPFWVLVWPAMFLSDTMVRSSVRSGLLSHLACSERERGQVVMNLADCRLG